MACSIITVQWCECICSGAVTAADQNSTWFLALGVAELPHDQDLDDDGGDGDYDHCVDHATMCGPALVMVMRICQDLKKKQPTQRP